MFYKQLSHVLRPTRSCLHLLHPLTISTTFLHFSYTLTALVQCSDTLVFFYTFSFSQPYESHTYCWYTGGILFHSCTPFHTFFLQNTISPACCWAHSCLFIPLLPLSYTSFHFYSPSSIFSLLSINICCWAHSHLLISLLPWAPPSMYIYIGIKWYFFINNFFCETESCNWLGTK